MEEIGLAKIASNNPTLHPDESLSVTSDDPSVGFHSKIKPDSLKSSLITKAVATNAEEVIVRAHPPSNSRDSHGSLLHDVSTSRSSMGGSSSHTASTSSHSPSNDDINREIEIDQWFTEICGDDEPTVRQVLDQVHCWLH